MIVISTTYLAINNLQRLTATHHDTKHPIYAPYRHTFSGTKFKHNARGNLPAPNSQARLSPRFANSSPLLRNPNAPHETIETRIGAQAIESRIRLETHSVEIVSFISSIFAVAAQDTSATRPAYHAKAYPRASAAIASGLPPESLRTCLNSEIASSYLPFSS